MLPFKFKSRQCEEITFRNAGTQNMNFFLRVHTNPSFLPFNDLRKSLEYFDSAPTEHATINPTFTIGGLESGSFSKTFNLMTTSYVIIELKSVQDEAYSAPFKVNMNQMNYIGDNLSNLAPFDFPLIVFRFTPSQKNKKQEFYTTEELCKTLTMRRLINFTPSQTAARANLMQQSAISQREKPFSIDQFAQRMAQFIIKRNSYKNAKSQIKDQQGQIKALMQQIHQPAPVAQTGSTVKTLRQLREECQEKRNLLAKKQVKFFEMEEDFRVVQEKFVNERNKETQARNEIFAAYNQEFRKESRTDNDNLAKVETCNFIYQQRLIKSLFDAFQVFFIPEAMQLYAGLEFINDRRPFKEAPLNDTEKENVLSVSLGQIVMVSLKLSQCLGIPLKHPMVFNSYRSSIIKQERSETKILPLYISQRIDYKTLDQAINLLGRNLRNILSALERIKERQGYGRVEPEQQEVVEPQFDNRLMLLLYRIAEFQVY